MVRNVKSAFTLIEVVFVIVILGVLAAVAIPKLAATRDNAYISKITYNIMTIAQEVSSSAIAKGSVDSNLSKGSNVLAMLLSVGEAQLNIPTKEATVKAGNVSDCVKFQVVASGIDENLTISFNPHGGDTICEGVQSLIDVSKYPIILKGQHVVR